MQQTQEMWGRSLGWEDSLEEELATHFSILARKIPWTEEPGRVAKGPWGHKELDMAEHARTCYFRAVHISAYHNSNQVKQVV